MTTLGKRILAAIAKSMPDHNFPAETTDEADRVRDAIDGMRDENLETALLALSGAFYGVRHKLLHNQDCGLTPAHVRTMVQAMDETWAIIFKTSDTHVRNL